MSGTNKLVKDLLDIPSSAQRVANEDMAALHREFLAEATRGAGFTVKQWLEKPQLHTSAVVYQKDSKFRPNSLRNIGDYTLLGMDTDFIYIVHPCVSAGFIYSLGDMASKSSDGIFPILSVHLSDSGIDRYKQASRLHIRESHAQLCVATKWYVHYVQMFDGIVSDFEHLEGGKAHWKPLVRTAIEHGLLAYAVETETGARTPVNQNTPDTDIWSLDDANRNVVLLLEKPQA